MIPHLTQHIFPSIMLESMGFLFAATWPVHVVSGHATKHGGEEIITRKCLEPHEEWQVWLEPSGRHHRLCQTPDGEIYDQIVEWTGKRWEKVTAFKPNPWGKGNKWNNIRQ